MNTQSPAVAPASASRRNFLKAVGVGAAALAVGPFRLSSAQALAAGVAPGGTTPRNFPAGIPLQVQAFQNWSHEISSEGVWTAVPASAQDIVTLANWAAANNYRLRARGYMHGWSPLALTPGESTSSNVVLVDMITHLTGTTIHGPGALGAPASVTAKAGTSVEQILGDLEAAGYGLAHSTAPGDVTIGGVLAIDGHGTCIPASGEKRTRGASYGSLSNLVLSLTAVVYDSAAGKYALKTFRRDDPKIGPMLTHLGRTIVTEVTLQVTTNVNLRCQSIIDVPAAEMFAAPGTVGALRTVESYLAKSGRMEVIWYPHTDKPWLKVWSVAPVKPLTSRAVTAPYNYPFSDNVPAQISDLATKLVSGNPQSTPVFGQSMFAVTAAGLAGTASLDLWGPSKNLLLYIKPTTLPVTANGYCVLTRRSSVQKVISDFTTKYVALRDTYQAKGQYPANMPVEIRVTGLDQPAEVDGVRGAVPPTISATAPVSSHPDFTVAVWFDVLSLVGTPGAADFYSDLEQWLFGHYVGNYALVRPEWSKGWAYSRRGGAWSDPTALQTRIPDAHRAGKPRTANWDTAVAQFAKQDPKGVFSNAFLNTLM